MLASGFASRASIPGQLLSLWTHGVFELVLSEPILTELAQTLGKPYFRKYLSSEQIAADIALLRREAIITPITHMVHGVATHPEDDVILATAVSGDADYLVTGDKQLQKVGNYQGVAIVSPLAFLDLLKRQ